MVSLGHVALDGTRSSQCQQAHGHEPRADAQGGQAAAAQGSDSLAAEQAELSKKAEAEATKAKAAREKAIEAAENASVEPPDLESLSAVATPQRGLAWEADGIPKAKNQRNFTAPCSHLMPSGGAYLPGYNCQLTVDSDHKMIVVVGASTKPSDGEHLEPMRRRNAASAGELPDVLTLDAGYWSEDNANACVEDEIAPYIATGRWPHGQPLPPMRRPMPKDADAKNRMARRLRSQQE